MANATGMNSPSAATWAPVEHELLALELRVAKRADEIAQPGARGIFHDIEHWLQAERDVLAVDSLFYEQL
jgi:hypothetical protein